MLPKLKDLQKAKLSVTQEASEIMALFIGKLTPIILLIVVVICIIALNSGNPSVTSWRHEGMNAVASTYQVISQPIVWLESKMLYIKQTWQNHNKMPQLLAENEDLKHRIKLYEGMEEENKRLQSLLHVVNHSFYIPVTARVVSENFTGLESKFLINAGNDVGIEEGMAVVNQDGLIGRVIEVAERSARVMALQDEQSSIPAIIVPDKRCIVRGGNGLDQTSLQIKYLKSEELHEGMEVITSGDGNLLPKGLNIGRVSKDGASVVPFFKLSSLDYVLVLKLKNQK